MKESKAWMYKLNRNSKTGRFTSMAKIEGEAHIYDCDGSGYFVYKSKRNYLEKIKDDREFKSIDVRFDAVGKVFHGDYKLVLLTEDDVMAKTIYEMTLQEEIEEHEKKIQQCYDGLRFLEES